MRTLFASLLVVLPTAAFSAMVPATCEIFDRTSNTAPKFVKSYLAASNDVEEVTVCRTDQTSSSEQDSYWGISRVYRDGDVCSFMSKSLEAIRADATVRLVGGTKGATRNMARSTASCPMATSENYTAVYNVESAEFTSLLNLWTKSIASVMAFDSTFARVAVHPAFRRALEQLRTAVLRGEAAHLRILEIRRTRNFGIWRRYRILAGNETYAPESYEITVTRFGGAYTVSGFGTALP